MRLFYALLALLIAGFTPGCRLFDDPNDVTLADAGRLTDASDAEVTDASSDAALDMPDAAPPAEDMLNTDAADSGDTGDLGDAGQPIEIDPFTLLELIRNEVCAYYARQDYHGTVFFGVGFRDEAGCREFFDVFLRNILGVLARDVFMRRAQLNEDAIRDMIDHVRTYSGDPRVFPITNVAGIVVPLSGLGDACSSNFACVSSPLRPAVCFLDTPEACDGQCVESARVCNGVLCGTDEFCFFGTCARKRPDGQACSNDLVCENRCLTDVCGTLMTGDDCTDNPDDCGAGAYCRTDVDPRLCAPLGILNEACTEDRGCETGHYCEATTGLCAEIAEGTPCRAGACVAGLECVQVSDVNLEKRCFAPRAAGEYCDVDRHCAPGTYCNLNTCTAAKPLGAACRDNRECESICRYDTSDATTGVCAQFVWGLRASDTCHVDAARCGMPFECETTGGTVLSGVCTAPARLDIDDACEANRPFWCPDGSSCRDGTCQPIAAAGAPCTINADCLSNLCVMGSCFDRVAECTKGLQP